jgi:hypothetical protein
LHLDLMINISNQLYLYLSNQVIYTYLYKLIYYYNFRIKNKSFFLKFN